MFCSGPSIDKIQRTLANIDTALLHQESDISLLGRRLTKLDLGTPALTSSRRGRFSAEPRRSPTPPLARAITPGVALTAAGALNAERGAQKLKRALLAARQEPLLNTSIKSSRVASSSKVSASNSTPGPAAAWSLPPAEGFDFSTSSSSSLGSGASRGRGGSSKHQKPVPLKKTPASAVGGASPHPPAAAPSGFSWGPLPPIHSAPKSGLAFDLRSVGKK
jgi:nucleoporin NUP159